MEGALAVRGGIQSLRARAGSYRDRRVPSVSTEPDVDGDDEAKRPTPTVVVSPMNDYFDAIPVSEFGLPPKGRIYCIDSNASVKDAVALLTEHNILSLPVRNAECKDPDAAWDVKFIGMVTMSDIVHFTLSHDPSPRAGPRHGGMRRVGGQALLKMMATKSAFTRIPVTDVLDSVHRFRVGKLLAVPEGATLLDVMLVLGKHGRHRIVVEDEHDITNIITQSAVLRLIHKRMAELGAVVKHTVAELGLARQRKIYTVSLDDEAKHAFVLIAEKHVSALPVVDKSGLIVGSISNRDIHVTCKSAAMSDTLHKTVRQFIEVAHQERDEMAPTITCHDTDTLESVINVLVATGVHRLYVVGDSDDSTATKTKAGDSLKGVISLSDIIDVFVSEPEGYFDESGSVALHVHDTIRKRHGSVCVRK